MPLELFFDLVFVLALTQCTALMADDPTWSGLAQGLLVLARAVVVVGRLRVADERARPRGGEGAGRDLRGDGGLPDRLHLRPGGLRRPRRSGSRSPTARSAARTSRLFVLASREDPDLRRSVVGLADEHRRRRSVCWSPASFLDGAAQGGVWVARAAARHGRAVLVRDEGWQLEPGALRRAPRADRDHRPRRVDRRDRGRCRGRPSTWGIAAAACSGIVLAAAMWWIYFDVVADRLGRRLVRGARRHVSRTRSPATPTPTSTS